MTHDEANFLVHEAPAVEVDVGIHVDEAGNIGLLIKTGNRVDRINLGANTAARLSADLYEATQYVGEVYAPPKPRKPRYEN